MREVAGISGANTRIFIRYVLPWIEPSQPKPQLSPTLNIGKCETAIQNASNCCPVSVTPPSNTVAESIVGQRRPRFAKTFSMAS